MELFTVTNVALGISLIASLYALLKTIAPKTKTTADDKVVEFVERARPWVFNFASLSWSIVESLASTGKIDKLNKYSKYMDILREGFEGAFGEKMPKALEADAQFMAQGLSAMDKLEREVSQNPQPPAAKEALVLKPQA
jgi:hypothetical protein